MKNQKYSIEDLKIIINETLDNIVQKRPVEDRLLLEKDREKKEQRRKQVSINLKNCGLGDIKSKLYIKEYIKDLLEKEYGINNENIDFIINFKKSSGLSVEMKFQIILHFYKKKYGYEALKELIEKYKLDNLKRDKLTNDLSYFISVEEIENIFKSENIVLDFKDKLEIVAQNIYEHTKGLGCIDEVRDMHIDGLSCGVSGFTEDMSSIVDDIENISVEEYEKLSKLPKSYDSVWLYYDGKEIALRFLGFGSEGELIRVSQRIYTWNNPGQLSQAQGAIVNTMADGSRIIVYRPPFAECWAFFIRKFTVKDDSLEEIIKGDGCEIPIGLCGFLMKGNQTTAITGDQGGGKTTLQRSMVGETYSVYTLRVVGDETQLRKRYPYRNILSVVSSQEAIDKLKKSNGQITIIEEVAEDEVASQMIQVATVASKFTVFTHHAKTMRYLFKALARSLTKTGDFKDEKSAMETVIEIVAWDIHLKIMLTTGERCIERITQRVFKNNASYTKQDYSELNEEERKIAFMNDCKTYFKRMTDKESYECRDICIWNSKAKRYEVKGRISDDVIKEMSENMIEEDKKAFKNFIDKYWGSGKEGSVAI